MCPIKKLCIDLYFQCGGAVAQAAHTAAYSFAFVIAATAGTAAQFTEIFPDAPQLRIKRMVLETTLVGKGKHLVVDTGRIADTQDIDATVYQFFRNPVDGSIALGTYQYLRFPMQGFIDGFH